MTLVSAPQHFTLGVLKNSSDSLSPKSVRINVRGRGMLCRVVLQFEFEEVTSDKAQFFAFECPWSAALSEVEINGEKAPKASSQLQRNSLPESLKPDAEAVCQGRNIQSVGCWVEPGTALKSMSFEFVLALELLWYRGELKFSSPDMECEIELAGSWNLTGLTGAALSFGGACSEFRLDTLEASKYSFKGTAKVLKGESASLYLKLDEKKAASLCLYSPPAEDGSRPGCSAVAVVAPVRPQLSRDPVSLALLTEVRSPQEGLIVRELIERIAKELKEGDRLCLRVLGAPASEGATNWIAPGDVDDETLAAVLQPSSIGRVENLNDALTEAVPGFKGMTHLVVATPGSSVDVGGTAELGVPTYLFGTGRHPSMRELDALATSNTGFVCAQHLDGLDSFLARLKIRLGAPLLSDFKLEGWGVEDSYPKGRTNVFMDRPTLSMGRYDGLLPTTVILGGLSPTGSRLAQRVKVEKIADLNFLPLYERKNQARLPQLSRCYTRSAAGVVVYEVGRPIEPTLIFDFDSETTSTFAPPTLDSVGSAVSLDEDIFGAPEPVLGGEDLFAGVPESNEDQDHLFGGVEFESDIFDSGENSEMATASEVDIFDGPAMPVIQSGTDTPFDAPVLANPEKTQPLLYVGDIQAVDDEPRDEVDPFASIDSAQTQELSRSDAFLEPVFESEDSEESSEVSEESSAKSETLDQESHGERPGNAETLLHVKLVKEPVTEAEDGVDEEPPKKPAKRTKRLLSWKDKPPGDGELKAEEEPKSSPSLAPQTDSQELEAADVDPREPEVREPEIAGPSSEAPDLEPQAGEGQSWVEHLVALDQSSTESWLATCSIDDIALGLVNKNREDLYERVLSCLSGPRKQAIVTQMELARLLDPAELAQASINLDKQLLQET